jgi:hypothetical protein
MQTLRRTATVLIWPTIAWLGAACDRLDPPTAVVQFSEVEGGPGKVTGGGQINVVVDGTPGTATFGFNAKQEVGADGAVAVSGHINYVNHVNGVHLNCEVTAAGVTPAPDGGTGDFGSNDCPKGSGQYVLVHVVDEDEPGRNNDEFTITHNGIPEGDVIRSGNIQVHKNQ